MKTLSSVSDYARRKLLACVDRGWLGLRPLRAHVVTCGFPRAGSTLLQIMVNNCVEDVRTFEHERRALEVIQHELRNHSYLFTKRPRDVLDIPQLRIAYAGRSADVRFLLTIRDPRAVLTSRHEKDPSNYYVSTERWRSTFSEYTKYKSDTDVAVIHFEDLLTRTDRVEQDIAEFIGWNTRLPFSRFHERRLPANFNAKALNGFRALDPHAIARWRDPVHVPRLKRVLSSFPEFPDVLIQLGYEQDDKWVSRL